MGGGAWYVAWTSPRPAESQAARNGPPLHFRGEGDGKIGKLKPIRSLTTGRESRARAAPGLAWPGSPRPVAGLGDWPGHGPGHGVLGEEGVAPGRAPGRPARLCSKVRGVDVRAAPCPCHDGALIRVRFRRHDCSSHPLKALLLWPALPALDGEDVCMVSRAEAFDAVITVPAE